MTLAAVRVAGALELAVTADVRRAQSDAERGRQQLEDSYRHQDPALAAAASASFARSRHRFEALARKVPAFAGGEAVPMSSGRGRLSTLRAVLDAGIHTDDAGMTAAQLLLTSGLVAGASVPGPPASPKNLTDLLRSIRGDLGRALGAARSIDPSFLPPGERPGLTRVRQELQTVVTGLDLLLPSLDAVLDVIGLNGPRTYLIEQVNPAELRSGGGFIGTVSLVQAQMGKVTLAKSLPVEAFDYCDAIGCVRPRPLPWQPGYVAPPTELTGYPLPPWSRLTAWSLEDSGFFPDFASSAAAARSFARELLGVDVDGVLAVDYYAVAPLLGLTGPIDLPQYKLTLTAANFVDTVVGLDLARDYAHKDIIAAGAARLVAGLSHLRPTDLPRLIEIVRQQALGRHLQAHFENGAVQRAAGRLGLSDSLNPSGRTDFLLETEDNYGGSKANYFLDRTFRLDLSRSDSALVHRLTVDLRDAAPADRPYIGPHYYAYVRATLPASATGVTVASADSSEYPPIQPPPRRSQEPPPGAQVAGGWIFIDVGEGLSGRHQVTFQWETPWSPEPDGSAALYWQKQAGTVADDIEITWSSGGGTYSAIGDLSEDRLLRLWDGGLRIEAPEPAAGRQP
jgi:Protein of unknown function (DUF4012)